MDPTIVRIVVLSGLWLVWTFVLIAILLSFVFCAQTVRRRFNTTQLLGPARNNDDLDPIGCKAKYGPVYSVPRTLFERTIVLNDASGIEHFYAQTPTVYRLTTATRRWTGNIVGEGLTWVDGAQHEAYRKVLTPLFGANAIESHAPTFSAMAKKVHLVWEQALVSRPRGMVVEISHWMNSVVLDSLGLAGFGYDFNSLAGEYCPTTAAFYVLRAPVTTLSDKIFRFGPRTWFWPLLRHWPGHRNRILREFQAVVKAMVDVVFLKQVPMTDLPKQSFIDSLMKTLAEDQLRLSPSEVATQVNTWLFSGFETTAASLTWVLIELAKHPRIQERLKKELRQLDEAEVARQPYLHAVVYESLRLHPPIGMTTRVAIRDDVIPLSGIVMTKAGDSVNSIKIAKGTHVRVPIRPVNTSKELWGPGAGAFDPERWWNLSTQDEPAPSGQKIKHLAFGDGSRACIGSGLALAMIKVVVFTLVRRYTFALPRGPQTPVEAVGEPVARPQVKVRGGSGGTAVMMVVRKCEFVDEPATSVL
ncbi:hypothetical protein MIND_00659700 [Mycena indigotica]|uniref:Cytochrome P450 n=1 Tax=Mycena indigotica TaxID=2126181 RepID=A0A8H6SKB1_9AGAR|nr:uncharacterized protein MIND_00659700 [Mycena indigotica]KAF7300966.1 hypothetical protein MIND_00659700 [Mycena indigotica]